MSWLSGAIERALIAVRPAVWHPLIRPSVAPSAPMPPEGVGPRGQPVSWPALDGRDLPSVAPPKLFHRQVQATRAAPRARFLQI